MKRNTVFLILIVLLSLSIGYLFGTQNDLKISATNSSHPSINKLYRLITYLTNDYVDEINADSLVREVIENIVDELDPHSIYLSLIHI